jgi:Helix-turn-helix domain
VAISVTNWVWNRSKSRHGARLVLLFIADSMRTDGGWAWPSNKEISCKAGLTARAVHTALADLAKLGELEIQYNGGPKGCNRYRVLTTPADIAPPQDPPPADIAPPQILRGSASSQVNTEDPAESAGSADIAPPQISTPTPAESAGGTVIEPKPKNSPTESSKRETAKTRGSRIADDFAVTAEMAEWARREVPGLIAAGLGRKETDKFIDHWHQASGANARKVDWVAAWRNWMRRADDDLGARNRGGGHNGNGHRLSTTDRAVAEADALKAQLRGES